MIAPCCSQPRPASAHAATASRQRPVWSSTPSARPDSAAKRAALATWTVSSGPEGCKGESRAGPARVIDQPGPGPADGPVRRLRSRSSARALDQVGGGSGTPDQQEVKQRDASAVTGAASARRARTPPRGRPSAVNTSASRGPVSDVRTVLQVGHDLVGPGQVVACGVDRHPLRTASTAASHPDHRVLHGVAGRRECRCGRSSSAAVRSPRSRSARVSTTPGKRDTRPSRLAPLVHLVAVRVDGLARSPGSRFTHRLADERPSDHPGLARRLAYSHDGGRVPFGLGEVGVEHQPTWSPYACAERGGGPERCAAAMASSTTRRASSRSRAAMRFVGEGAQGLGVLAAVRM